MMVDIDIARKLIENAHYVDNDTDTRTNNTENKEEDTTMKTTFTTLDGTTYTMNPATNRYSKTIDGKTTRIGKAEYESAKHEYEAEQYIANLDLHTDAEANTVWAEETEAEAERKAREDKVAADAKAVEDAMNGKTKGTKKTTRKPRRSKDVAYEGHGVTLTAKQVDFIRHLSDTCFWENGLDSAPWTDVLADEIGGQFAGKPMTTGAMISTICEKGLAERGKGKVNGKTATFMGLTELGKKVAAELGLE